GDAERGLAGFVEGQLEVITIQQVDAVEGRILRGRRDLRDDVVVLTDQVGADGLRGRIGNRSDYGAERQGAAAGVGINNRTNRGRSGVVCRGDHQLAGAVDAGRQVVGSQCRV